MKLEVNMKKILFLIILILVSGSIAFCENLQLITDGIYFDVDSVAKNTNKNGKFIKNEYTYILKSFDVQNENIKQIEKFNNKEISYHLVKDVINCKRKTVATKYFGLFEANGEIIQELKFDNYKQNESLIMPNSYAMILYNNICMPNNFKSIE